jgi:hypothetical protein
VSVRIYRSEGRRFAVRLTFVEADVIITTSAVDGPPLDVATLAVLDRDEAARLHADLGAWLEATA